MTAERTRLEEARQGQAPWRTWGGSPTTSLLFYEYIHGDDGAGIGASHQTGWTGIVARILHLFSTTTAQQVLELGQNATISETESAGARSLRGRP